MVKIENDYAMWYWNNEQRQAIIWEILKAIRGHEVGFLGNNRMHRGYSIGKIGFLVGQIKKRFVDKEEDESPEWNFYRSFEYVKAYDYELHKKLKLPDEWERYGWDFGIDLDADLRKTLTKPSNPQEAYENLTKGPLSKKLKLVKEQAIRIRDFYEKLHVPYLLSYSAYRGFHFTIFWDNLKDYFLKDDYPDIARELALFVKSKTELKSKNKKKNEESFFDLGDYGIRKLYRVPWTMHKTSHLICLPLKHNELDNFTVDMAKPQNILNQISIREYAERIREENQGRDLREFINAFKKMKSKKIEKIRSVQHKQELKETKLKNKIIERIKKELDKVGEKEKQEILKEVKKNVQFNDG